jgi:hypothetical protein
MLPLEQDLGVRIPPACCLQCCFCKLMHVQAQGVMGSSIGICCRASCAMGVFCLGQIKMCD